MRASFCIVSISKTTARKVHLFLSFPRGWQIKPLNVSCSVIPTHCSLVTFLVLPVSLNEILVNLFIEAIVEDFEVYSAILFLRLSTRRVDRDIEGWVDRHITCEPILVVKMIERHSRDAGVGIALFVRCVGDQLRDVLLKLSQIARNVPLRELGVVVIGHLVGHLGAEVCTTEVQYQILADKLQLHEFTFLVVDGRGLIDNFLAKIVVILIHVFDFLRERVIIQRSHLLVVLDLLVMVPVGLLQLIVLLVKLIHIVEELHVLLFSLNECSDDLINIVDTSGLHDGLKSLLDDLGVPHILIKQALLLDIFVHH